MSDSKKVADSKTEQVQLLMPPHINGAGKLFGGKLMEWIDILAGIVARRHSESNVLTAAIDNMQFKMGANLNDILVLVGRITYVGNSSMEVRVDTYVEDILGQRKIINRAYLVMVAVDDEGKPVPVPALTLETLTEEMEWKSGSRRYKLRKKRREEGY